MAYKLTQQLESGISGKGITNTAQIDDDVLGITQQELNSRIQNYMDENKGEVFTVEILGYDKLRNGQGTSTLTAYAYHNYEDVSDQLNSSAWSWKRISVNNEESDNIWNLAHKGYGRILVVDSNQTLENSLFICEVDFSKIITN